MCKMWYKFLLHVMEAIRLFEFLYKIHENNLIQIDNLTWI